MINTSEGRIMSAVAITAWWIASFDPASARERGRGAAQRR